MALHRPTPALLVVLALGAGCTDLTVPNTNDPNADRAVADLGTAEALIAGGFATWFSGTYRYGGAGLMLSTASFQHSTPWACGGGEYSWIPRTPLINDPAEPNCGAFFQPWFDYYTALKGVADGLGWLEDNPVVGEGDAPARRRARAVARLVQGLAHGHLALLYDRAFVSHERSPIEGREPVPYEALMDTALAFLDQAARLAEGETWPDVPGQWMSVPVSPDQLARLARSWAARLRAAVARTPAERAAVDWSAVIADVEAGITASWVMDMDPNRGFHNAVIDYGTYPGWAMETYFIIGMADQSGSYQRWLDMPLADRRPHPDSDGDGDIDPILVRTPDTRFPSGATIAEQQASPGSVYAIPDWGIGNVWARPDRGTWRWSYYWHLDTAPYSYWEDFHWPEIPLAEMRLLRAEGLLRLGDAATAATLVNISRTANGLAATDAAGTNSDCVPRLPDGSCGDLMEMLKWEKRLETHMKGLHSAPWYFDGRGWGDLYAGTVLHFPIPCADLAILDMLPCYTFGGVGGDGASPGSAYRWPDEG